MRILFDSKKQYYKSPFGALREDEKCSLCIDIPKSCKTVSVMVKLFREDGFLMHVPLQRKGEDGFYESFSCEFSLYERGLYFYHFRIKTEREEFDLYKMGDGTNMEEGELWQITCFDKEYDVPECFKGKVMYQIFPDRFAKSGSAITEGKLKPFIMHESTDETPVFLPNEKGIYENNDFFGGNLRGITEKIPYLKDLGIGIIYLNPIFFAHSNHRYDTADYKRIDPMLGSEDDFRALCEEAHENGIKIILDGVFSHTGSNSIYFDKLGVFGNGAYSNPDSPYREWYRFSEYPSKYESWWGIDTLPCVDEMCESYLDYVISSPDSVIAHWLKVGLDGFRLDVADELPDEFILMLKNRMKEINPQSLLIGEVWEDASNKISYGKRRRYFSDSELDSVMNYPFRTSIIDFVKRKIAAEEFAARIMTIVENYPPPVLSCVMNSLSTHDTRRIISELSNISPPDNKCERAHLSLCGNELQEAMSFAMAAAVLQFTLPGNPCIYYGDEIAMQGYEDPLNRAYFRWQDINSEMHGLYKNLSRIKNECDAIRLGSIEFVFCSDWHLCFLRKYKDEQVTVEISLDGQKINTENALLSFSKANVYVSIHK